MSIPLKKTDDSLSIFIEESNEILERLTVASLEMEKGHFEKELINGFYRDVHTLKGSAALYGFQVLSRMAHALESRFEILRSNPRPLTQAEADLVFYCLDALAETLKSVQGEPGEDSSGLLSIFEERLEQVFARKN